MQLKKASVLVVDDDLDILTAVRILLKPQVREVITERNPENIPHLLKKHSFDIVLLDMNYVSSINSGNEGLFWLRNVKEMQREVMVIMITAYGDIDLAIRSLKEGAYDFIVKPWHNKKLIEILECAVGRREKGGKGKTREQSGVIDPGLLGESEMMQDVFFKLKKVAPTDANILILGENGTGKELIARAIHDNSNRASKPFIKVDVGALTESLFESELFGHKKGAFTDAAEDRTGRVWAANGGTLFLDEIGNIPLYQQSKLLSVIQNRQIIPVGANEAIDVNIRLLCATNASLSELANEKYFRKDLVYRINTVEIMLPPLRERERDVILLAKHFINFYSEKYLKTTLEMTEASCAKLLNYSFPGNVRELQYAIERAVIMSENHLLEPTDLIFSPIESAKIEKKDFKETNLEQVEKNTILYVIERHNGNLSKAAKELGITRTALYRRLNKYEI